jgi:hypothetical protein
MSIAESVQRIRDYTAAHSCLQLANHFAYDVPLNCSGRPVEVVVFAINQAEYEEDRAKRKPGCPLLDDTSISSFRDPNGLGKAANWYSKVRSRIGHDRHAVLGELFFWSSRNFRELEDRYGKFDAGLNREASQRHAANQ